MEEILNVGILGYGTVGSGVVHILQDHSNKISQITGYKIKIKKVLVRDLQKERKYCSNDFLITDNVDEILDDKSISIVVEVMGSVDTAREYILRALKSGKHVITANKDLISLHGDELILVAQQNSCDLYFEASVAGGIPILRTIVNGLAADKIQKIMGIINGTTNYMLTKMKEEKKTYEEALEEAQNLGFAESDPTNDVDGIDAARKLSILARLSFGMNVELKDIITVGIRNLKLKDFQKADELEYVIKLLGIAEEIEGSVNLRVGPVFIPKKHPLSGVNNENNAVFVKGATVGETMFYGPGAGELPTATSVVSDIICVAKNKKIGINGCLFNNYIHETKKALKSQVFSKYYLRFLLKDRNSSFLKLMELFSGNGVEYEKVLQDSLEENVAIITIITSKTSEEQIENVIKRLNTDNNPVTLEAKYEVIE